MSSLRRYIPLADRLSSFDEPYQEVAPAAGFFVDWTQNFPSTFLPDEILVKSAHHQMEWIYQLAGGYWYPENAEHKALAALPRIELAKAAALLRVRDLKGISNRFAWLQAAVGRGYEFTARDIEDYKKLPRLTPEQPSERLF
jgi:hypothetical protein